MKVIGVIPARYKSSRFPGKPLVDICGKPMIWWVYEQCKKVHKLDDVYVATDDERIADVCKKYEMNVVMTSTVHPTGSDRVAEAAKKIEGDIFVNIQGDEPLIAPEMIEQVIELFDDENVYYGTLKEKIDDENLIQSINTVKVVTDNNDDAMFFSRSVIPSNVKDGKFLPVYRHVGIYAYTRDFLQKYSETPQSQLELSEGMEALRALELGYKMRVAETTYSSIGVDTPEQAVEVENIIKRNMNRG
ncbi:MAG: 3-deoxy-manno-octulosonate cytidylyltransferase [Lachnobacterium sp.]|nr:3-deoxy-manno-octulosonate cytidylyltransferase [Lachnobacterium sp.]